MANPEHLEILGGGVEVWNRWREKSPGIIPNLNQADLGRACLKLANLGSARLDSANVSHANLRLADLRHASLRGAVMRGTDLSKADLRRAALRGADMRRADLSGALLRGADLRGADLGGADLSEAGLLSAIFLDTRLQGTNLTRVHLGDTIFTDVDLSQVMGLESVLHRSPSSIGVDTIYKSRGNIPEAFLRGCGLPESFITQVHALITSTAPIQFYSCFISYSSADQDFAERLHADLQARGVRVWFAPHDLPIGSRIRPAIDESIRLHDKLLLVLSETSVKSQWVEQEVETALAREREQEGKTVLFPVRIDDAVMGSRAGWPALLKNTRNVGDFTRWKDHDSYSKAFERLLRDLKAEA